MPYRTTIAALAIGVALINPAAAATAAQFRDLNDPEGRAASVCVSTAVNVATELRPEFSAAQVADLVLIYCSDQVKSWGRQLVLERMPPGFNPAELIPMEEQKLIVTIRPVIINMARERLALVNKVPANPLSSRQSARPQ